MNYNAQKNLLTERKVYKETTPPSPRFPIPTSPILSRFSDLSPNSSHEYLIKSKAALKQEMQDLRDLPESEYKSRLQSLLNIKDSSPSSLSSSRINLLDLTSQSKKIQNSLRASPKHLSPLFSMRNHISRAGYKIRAGLVEGRQKLPHASSVIIKPNLQNIKGQYLFAIADGHGPHGNLIADHIRISWPGIIEIAMPLEAKASQMALSLISASTTLNNSIQSLQSDTHFSGSSLISLIICGNVIYTSNTGNCKAIVAQYSDSWSSFALNILHDLQNTEDLSKILELGGELKVERKPNRNNKEKLYVSQMRSEGFETTRAFGDFVGKYIGLNCTPDVGGYNISDKDRFLVIANSTVWRVLTDAEIIEVVKTSWKVSKTDKACQDIVDEVERRAVEQDFETEDITVIVVFFTSFNQDN